MFSCISLFLTLAYKYTPNHFHQMAIFYFELNAHTSFSSFDTLNSYSSNAVTAL